MPYAAQPTRHLVCTLQRHPTGGYTPTVHPVGTMAPVPTPWAVTFPTTTDALRWVRNRYGTLSVELVTGRRPAA
ncbi:hypothetical protein [Nocardioides pocheonensis]|jgi:hypothetical protein|uniref:Uncharacterized protein n=1 Tax=Nocardioides pocheonensis TaxID=661485 RepID=A0A3N0GJ75_9ACTN|nr:hypothetical protein [Nocardioides pocheonensis]RNM12525.1 hypothetical protein EFL26_18000 [Nocardioides pocheonensis]